MRSERPLTHPRFGARTILRDRTASAVLVLVAIVIGFGMAAVPRFINEKSDEALQTAASEATVRQRNISFVQYRRISPDAQDPLSPVHDQGADLLAGIEGPLGAATGIASTIVDSPLFEARDFPVEPGLRLDRWFTFRTVDGLGGNSELIEGTFPAPAGDVEIVPGPCPENDSQDVEDEPDSGCEPIDIPLFETVITTQTSELFRLDIGDRLLLAAAADIPNNRNLPRQGLDYQVVLEVSGLVELSDASNDFWQGDSLAHSPSRVPAGFTEFDTFATGFMSVNDYERLLDVVLPSRFLYRWNFSVDLSMIDTSNIDDVAAEQTKLELEFQGSDGITAPILSTGLDRIVDSYERDRRTTVTLISQLAAGLLGIAVATLFVVASLAAKRREASTILIRGRGGESPRLALGRYVEGFVLFLPSMVLGLILAMALVGGRSGPTPALWALASALGLAAIYVVSAMPPVFARLGTLVSGTRHEDRQGRRIILELTVVAMAAIATILLRRRGLNTVVGFDPLLTLVPLLVSVAVAVILLRIVPVAARGIARISTRKGIVGLIGFHSLSRRSLAAQLPPVVALIGVAISVFGVVLSATIADTQEKGSWQAVGANYRLEPFNPTGVVSPQLDLKDVAAVSPTAAAVRHSAGVTDNGAARGSIELLAIDLVDYERVTRATDADPLLPPGRMDPGTLVDVGTESNPIPAITSPTLAGGPVRRGEVHTMVIGFRPVVVVIEETRDAFPGTTPGEEFVVISRPALAASNEVIAVQPNILYINAPDAASSSLANAVREQQPGLRFISRPDRLDAIRARPAVNAIRAIITLALVASAVFASIAVINGFALTSNERRRDMGYLRAIGLSVSQMGRAMTIEQIPPALAAAILGGGTGVGVWLLVKSAIDLEPVTGTALDFGSTIPWPVISAVGAVVVGTLLLSAAIYSYATREMDLATVLRRGERT